MCTWPLRFQHRARWLIDTSVLLKLPTHHHPPPSTQHHQHHPPAFIPNARTVLRPPTPACCTWTLQPYGGVPLHHAAAARARGTCQDRWRAATRRQHRHVPRSARGQRVRKAAQLPQQPPRCCRTPLYGCRAMWVRVRRTRQFVSQGGRRGAGAAACRAGHLVWVREALTLGRGYGCLASSCVCGRGAGGQGGPLQSMSWGW